MIQSIPEQIYILEQCEGDLKWLLGSLFSLPVKFMLFLSPAMLRSFRAKRASLCALLDVGARHIKRCWKRWNVKLLLLFIYLLFALLSAA
jgi:hypothetical protein